MTTPNPATTEWVPLAASGGPIGPVGPQGAKGDKGDQGNPGAPASIPARLGPGAVLVTDMNQANETGFWCCDYDPLNSPGYGQWCIWVIKNSVGDIQQIALNSSDDTAVWVRAYTGSSWTSWMNVYQAVPSRLGTTGYTQPSSINSQGIVNNGWYNLDSTATNMPFAGFSWTLRCETYDSNNVVHTAWVRNSSTLSAYQYQRVKINGTWSAWRCISPALMATTLPSNPIDGQEAILVDSVTNPTYQWRFRYNAGSSSTYKWEYVGGTPAVATVASAQSTTTTGSTLDLTTVGPRIIVPNAGDYYVDRGHANMQHTVANATGSISPWKNTATSGVGAPIQLGPANIDNSLSFGPELFTALIAGDDLRLRYFMGTAGTCNWSQRRISVIPKRIS